MQPGAQSASTLVKKLCGVLGCTTQHNKVTRSGIVLSKPLQHQCNIHPLENCTSTPAGINMGVLLIRAKDEYLLTWRPGFLVRLSLYIQWDLVASLDILCDSGNSGY
jgi:hypothetical protein